MKGKELYDIARYLGVPQKTIDAKPDDDLGITSGGDEAQLGADYPVIDEIMLKLIQSGFEINGSSEQLKSLPKIESVPSETVFKIKMIISKRENIIID